MRLDNGSFNGDLYNYGIYKGCLAYSSYGGSRSEKIYVFKDISPRRLKVKRTINMYRNNIKIIFVTNEQLLKMDYFSDLKNCVFDGKLGQGYESRSSCGGYFWCKKWGNTPTPRKPRRHT